LTHHLADDEGALPVRPVRLQPEVVHRVEHAPVDRLQPVADVGQRAPDDHAHRVVEIRGAHLLLELALLDVAVQGGVQRVLVSVSHQLSPPQTSRKRTSRAWRSMNSLRGSTLSPIRSEKVCSRPLAAASSMLTCWRVRVSGSMVVSRSCSAFISPSPLKRDSVTPCRASSRISRRSSEK